LVWVGSLAFVVVWFLSDKYKDKFYVRNVQDHTLTPHPFLAVKEDNKVVK